MVLRSEVDGDLKMGKILAMGQDMGYTESYTHGI
jgi:hypothetical protein